MGKLFSLVFVLALGYVGLYFYYGVAIKQEVQQQLDDRGMTAVSVDSLNYDWLAPINTSANVSADVTFKGASASMELAVEGHPLFSDELKVSFDGLQGLSLGIGFGQ
ncbi:hypothetical protein ACU6TU_02625 [Halomonas sp. LS-001]